MKKSAERQMQAALVDMVVAYVELVELVESGDAGKWNPNKDECVIDARAALAAYHAKLCARSAKRRGGAK